MIELSPKHTKHTGMSWESPPGSSSPKVGHCQNGRMTLSECEAPKRDVNVGLDISPSN